MPTETPNIAAPLWDAAQASPWLTVNQALRIFDAFAAVTIVDEADRTAPPGTCSDGARYLVKSVATGLWAGHEGDLAIAVGANASNGWQFADIAIEGQLLYDRETQTNFRYISGVWTEFSDTVSRLNDLLDVDTTGVSDGYVLKWDTSNGFWYPAPDSLGSLAGALLVANNLSDVGNPATAGANIRPVESFVVAASDESTALTTGTGKLTFRMPYGFTVTEMRASLSIAQTSGTTLKVDVNEAGTSILGANKLTFDNGQKSTGTAAQSGITITTVSSIADASIADNAEMTLDIDALGDGTAKGLKVTFIGHRT